MDDEPPLIEVLGDGDDPERDVRGTDRARWHTAIRTAAAVVAAIALLWVGSSVAGLRTTNDEQSCRHEVESTRWMLEELAHREGGAVRTNGRADLPSADAEQLVEQARGCGLHTYAELLERWYADDEDDEASGGSES